ncbi:MAG: PhzF family phenazine biosynthesis protein [Chitinophaga sp.]|uniref:PhzF family phenazine biosynthesis protein n=1 Tax=Chitinophaga sp. TaxID=1869181 RepID=UPI0025C1F241|nr:PhzF family phenazine biosynthesis protein [Chitinophaga sp.]MBV8253614.1 PhzF family phenazine biosynthesis protein [Chitinophaga sp.]
MKFTFYQIDAFTHAVFGGNPACVVPLNSWLPDDVLRKIAAEQGVPETAFFIQREEDIELRWFTPEFEIDLCGHATLATAHVLKTFFNRPQPIKFNTLSGPLTVTFAEGKFYLDFPSRKPELAKLPINIKKSLSVQPVQVLKARDYVLVYENQAQIENIKIDRKYFDELNLDPGGVVITSPGIDFDFVSRYFVAQASIFEDPVTGSAHCSLIPYWAERLGKTELKAAQLSDRKGFLHCLNHQERVLIGGAAKTFSTGNFWIE